MKTYIVHFIIGIMMQGCAAGLIVAQTMDVPVKNQFQLFAKILTYDRKFTERIGNQIVLGVIYQPTYRSSSAAKDELVSLLEESGEHLLGEIPVRYELIDVSSTTNLSEVLSELKVNLLYITPLRAVSFERIFEVTRSKKILTLTGVSHYAEDGIAVSISIKNDRPQIIINLPSAKSEGADFSSNFLKLTRVIQ